MGQQDKKLKDFIDKLVQNEISEAKFITNEDFIVNSNFSFEEVDIYLKNFAARKKIALDKEKHVDFNKSLVYKDVFSAYHKQDKSDIDLDSNLRTVI